MNQGFWEKLKKPFFVLAPMLDITDSPFRQIITACGKPDVFYTWFVSVDGLFSVGKENILKSPNLKITRKEKPIITQLFGKDPHKFFESARIMAELGFDGIDINFGCPDKDIVKQGAGSALIKDLKLAKEIIRETKKGAGKLPVSIKTRIGFSKKQEMEEWVSCLLEEKPAAISIHGRTATQRYGGTVDWDTLKKAADLARGSETLIIGNGDIKNRNEGIVRAREVGLDGIMIGRAALAHPWVFAKKEKEIMTKIKLDMLLKHAELFGRSYENKSFNNFKKFLRSYVNGFEGSKELRMKLMEAKDAKEIRVIINA